MSIARMVKGSFEPIRLGGAGEKLVREIEEKRVSNRGVLY